MIQPVIYISLSALLFTVDRMGQIKMKQTIPGFKSQNILEKRNM